MRRYFFPKYAYNFNPAQLCFLCQCIEETREIAGAVAEIGCSDGSTTIFLKKYMDSRGIRKDYYAVDTFSGFVAADVEFEIERRGKTKEMFAAFQRNKKKWFDGTMDQNALVGVRSIQADVNEYDLTELGPLSFVLLDVDLYRPMKKSLKELYEILSPGGIMIVDDCDSKDIRWDGSGQAYREFMKEINEAPRVVHGKLGEVRKRVH